MQRWEYLTVRVNGLNWRDSLSRTGELPGRGESGALLNDLGEQGWELASVQTYGVVRSEFGQPSGEFSQELFLKRPRL